MLCCQFCCVLLLLRLRAFVGYWSVCVCRIFRPCAVLLAGWLRDQIVFFSLFLLGLPLSHAPVCRFKTSPCVPSKRLRVCRHHAHMCFNMCAWCRYTRTRAWCRQTRRRSERTHGDVLNSTNVFFQRVTPHTTTPHKTQHPTPPQQLSIPQHTHTPHKNLVLFIFFCCVQNYQTLE